MKSLSANAYAKINLFLDVVAKRTDGYHDLESVMQSVTLCDTVSVTLGDNVGKCEIRQSMEGACLPCDETNLCYKAAKSYLEHFAIEQFDIDIKVKKRIPASAGLAGGSTDAAAVIRLLDALYEKNSTDELLCEIGLRVGSDVPFCMLGGTCEVRGRGEHVKRLPSLAPYHIVVAKSNDESVSTKLAFDRIDNTDCYARPCMDFYDYVKAVSSGDRQSITHGVYNIFSSVMGDELPAMRCLVERMKQYGAQCAIMSGSGPSVFGVFATRDAANAACEKLKRDSFACVCEFCTNA